MNTSVSNYCEGRPSSELDVYNVDLYVCQMNLTCYFCDMLTDSGHALDFTIHQAMKGKKIRECYSASTVLLILGISLVLAISCF